MSIFFLCDSCPSDRRAREQAITKDCTDAIPEWLTMSRLFLFIFSFVSPSTAQNIGGIIVDRSQANVPCVGNSINGYQMIAPNFCLAELAASEVDFFLFIHPDEIITFPA